MFGRGDSVHIELLKREWEVESVGRKNVFEQSGQVMIGLDYQFTSLLAVREGLFSSC